MRNLALVTPDIVPPEVVAHSWSQELVREIRHMLKAKSYGTVMGSSGMASACILFASLWTQGQPVFT